MNEIKVEDNRMGQIKWNKEYPSGFMMNNSYINL